MARAGRIRFRRRTTSGSASASTLTAAQRHDLTGELSAWWMEAEHVLQPDVPAGHRGARRIGGAVGACGGSGGS